MEKNLIIDRKRECGSCTMCCQWLTGEVYGHQFYAGHPCHFLSCDGCTIYKNRPEIPCKAYECAWLSDKKIEFPEWFRPDQSKIICSWKEWKSGFYYLDVDECGEQINSRYLNWLINAHFKYKLNINLKILGGITYFGEPEFLEFAKNNTCRINY